MTEKVRSALLAPNLQDGITVQAIEAQGTGVVGSDNACVPRKLRLTLTNFSISVAAGDDYGGTKLLDLADRNLMLLGMEVDCVVTKQGNTNGIVAATDISMSVGTGVAAATPLAGTAIDVIEATSITADALAVDFEKHSNDQSTAVFPKKIADGASSALYMNIAAAITANSSVSVSGIIDIFYIDLGNLAS